MFPLDSIFQFTAIYTKGGERDYENFLTGVLSIEFVPNQ